MPSAVKQTAKTGIGSGLKSPHLDMFDAPVDSITNEQSQIASHLASKNAPHSDVVPLENLVPASDFIEKFRKPLLGDKYKNAYRKPSEERRRHSQRADRDNPGRNASTQMSSVLISGNADINHTLEDPGRGITLQS